MANYLAKTTNDYYTGSKAGEYQFTSLETVINQFIVSYVGEDKIISKIKRADVAFHAQRALQELSFDTFKSCKAQELTVPPTLINPVPHDYVNYTKLTWVDGSGIEHIIYPARHTSNPQYKGSLISNSHFYEGSTDWTLGTSAGGNFSWINSSRYGGAISGGAVNNAGVVTSTVDTGTKISVSVPFKHGKTYRITWNTMNVGDGAPGGQGNFQVYAYGEEGYILQKRDALGNGIEYDVGSGVQSIDFAFDQSNEDWRTTADTNSQELVFEVSTVAWAGVLEAVVVTEIEPDGNNVSNMYDLMDSSSTWGNYKSTTPSENNKDDYEDDTYWPAHGSRFGLEPEHAQTNGSYYIDCTTGMIHFSSNLSGKTVILHYLSDSLGSTQELQVHKLAEEAVYKWIAYAVLSTRANTPEYLVQRLKKERFAETRKAKLRLSNIKLEEITQILRGQSKFIKH
tara:strand:+ start:1943 stop:3304 length:1362 start_codon:yes stop_codon:yes gene_type:complete